MLDHALALQTRYENATTTQQRKPLGQVFTPPTIARYMAGLFENIDRRYRLLDPGAGTGVLTAAFCERVLSAQSPFHLSAHLFEIDSSVVPILTRNMERCQLVLEKAGHTFDYVIDERDFVIETADGLDGQQSFIGQSLPGSFDGVIMNPPYLKVRKDSEYARLMNRIVHGQPNLYAFFMALASRLLKEQGELVAITPRSFCNGLYFRGFRRWFFERMALRHIHLFESRTDTFRGSGILQESIITKCQRSQRPTRQVNVTTSFGQELCDNHARFGIPSKEVFDDTSGNLTIRIPSGLQDLEIMRSIESLPQTFEETGLRISTGPVVMFRATDHLLESNDDTGAVPLLHPHNVKPFKSVWPLSKHGKPMAMRMDEESRRLLIPVRNYVLLKRFSAKEEKRRLTAGCYLASRSSHTFIGLENHLNYVYRSDRELSDNETFGVAAFFNSELVDRYFRTISGNTQVNATEIRSMSFPDMKTIAKIGKQVKTNQDHAELIVLDELGINGEIRQYLTGAEK
jgi:adenine-specific DNA-methyltransferase